MDPIKKKARWAGFLYFIASIPAPIGLMYVPGKLIVTGNATATADNIRGSETLWRIGIGCGLLSQILFIFVALALYRLFPDVDAKNARLIVVLGCLVSAPIMFVNDIAMLAALTLVKAPAFLSAFDRGQLDALAYLFLRFNSQGTTIASIFWGLWLFPLAALVIRSGFIPRWIGYALVVAGSAYAANAVVSILLPQYAGVVGSIALPLEIAELPIIFWLMIWGARAQSLPNGAAMQPGVT
jgi:hypothetical protein